MALNNSKTTFTLYDKLTGKLTDLVVCLPSELHNYQTSDKNVLEASAVLELQYIPDVNNPVITDRPTNPTTIDKTTVTANGIDAITLSNIPTNSTIEIKGAGLNVNQVAANPTETITFSVIGTYTIKVTLFPYLDFEGTINAN